MPHGESWFSLLPLHGRFAELVASRFGDETGHTWIAGTTPGVQHVYGALFVLSLLVVIGIVTDNSIREAKGDLLPPGRLTLRNAVELIVDTCLRMMADIMGSKAARYFLPLIGTCAFFILLSNAVGLIPGFLPPTNNLNITLGCAIIIFFATHIYGVREHGLAYFKHFVGPIPWLAPLMLPIELISHLARPVSLSVRLMANMTADHLVLTIFVGFLSWATIWLPIPLPMYALGMIVVIVQTLVFCLLSAVYIAMAIEHAEH